jgi:hypothetical protein
VYAFANGIEFKTFDLMIKQDEIVFNNGHLFIQGEPLRIKDHPDTGLPFKNFEIQFEFITSDKETALFSIDSPIGKGGHDRHILLKNG